MRYNEAKSKLESELHKAFLDGVTLVEIVHGIGSGRLKQLVLDTVLELGFGSVFETGDDWQNPGTTQIELYPPDSTKGFSIKRDG